MKNGAWLPKKPIAIVAAGTPRTRVMMTVVMKSDVASVICCRFTSVGMLAASAGAKICPAELNSSVITINGHA